MTILENSSIPNVDVALIENSDSSSINTSEFFSSGKFVLVGVPGAFTPTCHLQHFPGYVESNQAFVDKGYRVVFMSVNDQRLLIIVLLHVLLTVIAHSQKLWI
jgi:peroxiredoxin